jgi:hypothetical protein
MTENDKDASTAERGAGRARTFKLVVVTVDDILAYYDEAKFKDWTHAESGAEVQLIFSKGTDGAAGRRAIAEMSGDLYSNYTAHSISSSVAMRSYFS